MSINFKVPAKLAPFKAIFEWLSSIPVEQLNEDIGLSFVDATLRTRYGGLSFPDAEKRLSDDRKALERLCESQGQNSSWLYFFLAYLSPHVLPQLIEEQNQEDAAEPPPLTLHIDLPSEFQVTHDYGSILASNSSATVTLIPTAESVLAFKLANFQHQAQRAAERAERSNSPIRVEYSFHEIQWRDVSGWRVVVIESGVRQSKEIHYLLKVPGGASIVEVRCNSLDFDEKSFESLLLNLKVQSHPSVDTVV